MILIHDLNSSKHVLKLFQGKRDRERVRAKFSNQAILNVLLVILLVAAKSFCMIEPDTLAPGEIFQIDSFTIVPCHVILKSMLRF